MIYTASGKIVVAVASHIGNDRYIDLITADDISGVVEQLKSTYGWQECEMEFDVDCGDSDVNREIKVRIYSDWLDTKESQDDSDD